MLRYKRCASAGVITQTLCERNDRVLVKRKMINYNDGSCVRIKAVYTGRCVGRCCDTGVTRTKWSCTRRKVISYSDGSSSRLFEGKKKENLIIRALLTGLHRSAPKIVLKRTPSVTTSACVLTNTRSYLPSIKACGLNQIKEGSELPSYESDENLCVRALSDLYSPRHFETYHPLF
jgi:hypothetical protein